MTAVLYAYGPDIDAVAAVRANAVTNARNNQQTDINQGHQLPNGPSFVVGKGTTSGGIEATA